MSGSRGRSALAPLLGVLAITLLTAELGLRLVTFSGRLFGFPLLPLDLAAPIRAARGVDFATTYLVFDRELGWVVGPSRHSQNGLYESTPDGARRIGDEPKPGERALAIAFGDSFTHGDDVKPAETWQHALASRAHAPVVDFGVPGFGVDQALLRYRRVAASVPSEWVLIGFMADNVGRHVNHYRPLLSPEESVFFAKPRFVADGDGLRLVPQPFARLEDYFANDAETKLETLLPTDAWYRPEWYEHRALDLLRSERVLRTVRALRETRGLRWRALYDDPTAVELTRRILVAFAHEVAKDGRKPLVVFFPDRSFTEDALAGRAHPASPLLQRLAADGVATLDTTPAIVDHVRAGHPIGAQFVPHYAPGVNDAVGALLARALRPGG